MKTMPEKRHCNQVMTSHEPLPFKLIVPRAVPEARIDPVNLSSLSKLFLKLNLQYSPECIVPSSQLSTIGRVRQLQD